jgi:uncharacterized protein
MQGSVLDFYVHEGDRHGGQMVWEWLMEEANKHGVGGGSVFRAVAGFGRGGVLHARKFFELAGSQVLKVEFIVTNDEARELLAMVRREKLKLFYVQTVAEFGVTD